MVRLNANPLRIFLTSDYPLGVQGGPPTSASAHQIRDAALGLHERGHEVVVLAPGYNHRPEITPELPFPVRTLLFTPTDRSLIKSTIGSRFPFDIPVLDINSNHCSQMLLSKFTDEMVDQLICGYMGMFRMTSLIFGEPDVIVSSHAVSLWNYVASNYPLVVMSSESDMIPDGASMSLRHIINVGVRHAFGGVAFSRLVANRLAGNRSVVSFPEDHIVHAPREIDRELFGPEGETTKDELLFRFKDKLEGVSSHEWWVVLYDQFDHPAVADFYLHVAALMERGNERVRPIFITESKGYDLCERYERFQLERARFITEIGRLQKSWFMHAADRALVYMGYETPAGESDVLERDLIIAGQSAVAVKSQGGGRLYFPGAVDPTSQHIIDETLRTFDVNAVDLKGEIRVAVRNAIVGLAQDSGNGFDLLPESQVERPHVGRSITRRIKAISDKRIREIEEIAFRHVRYMVRKIAMGRLSDALQDSRPVVNPRSEWRSRRKSITSGQLPLTTAARTAGHLEPFLFRAKHEASTIPAVLERKDHERLQARQDRLDAIVFDPDARSAWEEFTLEIEVGGEKMGSLFRYVQYEVLKALCRSSFLHPAVLSALPNPRINPNAIFSEVARLLQYNTEDLLHMLRHVEEADPSVLIQTVSVKPENPPPQPPSQTSTPGRHDDDVGPDRRDGADVIPFKPAK